MNLDDLVSYTDQLLDITSFSDYCPNGLQVAGRPEVRHIVSGVTASEALLRAAVSRQADMVLVHHGYFWKGEDPRVVGMKRKRLGLLLANDINLVAYHLPLDAHPELGNNAQLARRLGLQTHGTFGNDGPRDIGQYGTLSEPLAGDKFARRLTAVLGREPLYVPGNKRLVKRVAWCTGGAQSYIEAAARLGVDAYITGEISEHTVHVARELELNFYSAGHHATERYGVQALGDYLAQQFGLRHEFVDIDNPA